MVACTCIMAPNTSHPPVHAPARFRPGRRKETGVRHHDHRHENHRKSHRDQSGTADRRWKRRLLSQNFLFDPATIAGIAAAARPDAGDLIVEIGAGEGLLTRALARECRRVVAYELDAALARRLAARYWDHPKIECVHADFLTATPPPEPFAVVGNIPFGGTSRIVRWCLAARGLTSATLVTQLDYARRRGGDRGRWSLLTVRTWPRFDWRLLGAISREHFRPVPSVDSGILRLERRREPLLPAAALREYEAFVATGFGGVGGTLRASLGRRYGAARVNVAFRTVCLDPGVIVAFVHPDDWIALFIALHARPAGPDVRSRPGTRRSATRRRFVPSDRAPNGHMTSREDPP
jgi:23S rRNA (adenine-N6)-dimethyltransferase